MQLFKPSTTAQNSHSLAINKRAQLGSKKTLFAKMALLANPRPRLKCASQHILYYLTMATGSREATVGACGPLFWAFEAPEKQAFFPWTGHYEEAGLEMLEGDWKWSLRRTRRGTMS